jgi:hypothetical protein
VYAVVDCRCIAYWPIVCTLLIAGLPNDQDNGFGGGMIIFTGCTGGCLVDRNTFISNKVTKGGGGGFYSAAPATMVVTNNKFINNTAGAELIKSLATAASCTAFDCVQPLCMSCAQATPAGDWPLLGLDKVSPRTRWSLEATAL